MVNEQILIIRPAISGGSTWGKGGVGWLAINWWMDEILGGVLFLDLALNPQNSRDKDGCTPLTFVYPWYSLC